MTIGIPKGITVQDVREAAQRWEAGEYREWYGEPTGYFVEVDGNMYPPKAIVGIAATRLAGQPLPPAVFSGGVAAGQAAGVLEALGFKVWRKEGVQGSDWSLAEVSLTVEFYFHMLALEQQGRDYSKAEFRRALLAKLPGRSEPSIEFKHANISAVLDAAGLSYIAGYKPRGNYQKILAEAVEKYLRGHPEAINGHDHPKLPVPPVLALQSMLVEPPAALPTDPKRSKLSAVVRQIAEKEAANRELGSVGEEFVFEVERAELVRVGRPELAEQVEWVAKTKGDGLGYDILSFDAVGVPKRIEVKTTRGARKAPFYLTANEVAASEVFKDEFWLYRLFDFAKSPKLFVLRGPLVHQLKLTPVQYRADW